MFDQQQLIARSKSGCLDAFGELIRRYQTRLFARLYGILHNAEDARDAVQETFLLAYQSLHRFEERSDFYTWLYRIGMNAAIDCKRKRRPVKSLQTLVGGDALDWADRSRENEPGRALAGAEEATLVWKALGCLTQRDRTLLVLKDMEGLHYDELATLLCIPIGTVRSRLHRARLKLRQLLEDHGW